MKTLKNLDKITLVGLTIATLVILPLLITVTYEILVKGSTLHY